MKKEKKPQTTFSEPVLLPDGSGYFIASMPLPAGHWIYLDEEYEPPPMIMRMGLSDPRRSRLRGIVQAAGRYAVRAATMNGTDMDFDPDALVQNLVVGLLGYHTLDGLSSDDWANPKPIPPVWKE